ncbi:MAG TPA: acyl carrier protein [Labilithrix sp.]|nr:acyl carrier protein [Labilithrix sp.]
MQALARSALRTHLNESRMMQRTELLQVFARTAAEVAEKEFANVLESTSISELGIDSLGMLEIIGSLERELKIHIPDESLAGILTVKDLLNAVESRQSA